MIFRTLPVLVLCAIAILPLRAHATAIYSGAAAITTSVTGTSIDAVANGTSITATSEAVPDAADFAEFLSLLLTGYDLSGAFTTGGGTATKSGTGVVAGSGSSTDFYPGGTMVQSATVNGSATAPGDYSLALQLTNGFITIDNSTGAADITVSLGIDYIWSTEASAGGSGEYAEATASLVVDIFKIAAGVGEVLFDSTALDILEIAIASGTGSESLGNSDVFTLDILVAAGDIAYIDIFSDAQGLAEVVSEPPLIAVISLLALIVVRRKWRAGSGAAS